MAVVPAAPRCRLRLATVLSIVAATVVGTATSAAAHHAEVNASADCTATVSFVAQAWEGQGTGAERDRSRTNDQIEVAWSTGGHDGGFTVLPHQPSYRFGTDNDFRFADSFTAGQISAGVTVTVRVQAKVDWGNGVGPGGPRYDSTTIPARCPQPTVSVECPESLVYGREATFTAKPTGDGPFTYRWSQNGEPIPGATGQRVTTTLAKPSDVVAVTVTDRYGQTASATASCHGRFVPPAVTVRCPESLVYGQPATWTAVVRHDANDPVTLQWSKNGAPIAGANGVTMTTTVDKPADVIKVTVTGHGNQSDSARADCAGRFVAPTVTIRCPVPTTADPHAWSAVVTHDANDTVTLQWFKNDEPIPGANGAILAADVTLGADDVLKVTVTDSQGQTASDTATAAECVAGAPTGEPTTEPTDEPTTEPTDEAPPSPSATVGGVQTTRPRVGAGGGTLPLTGAAIVTLVAGAALLIGLGTALTRRARRLP